MVTPTIFPVDKKASGTKKKVEDTNVLIPWYPISYLTIASSGFFGGGALMGPYPTLRFGGACGRGVGAFDLDHKKIILFLLLLSLNSLTNITHDK